MIIILLLQFFAIIKIKGDLKMKKLLIISSVVLLALIIIVWIFTPQIATLQNVVLTRYFLTQFALAFIFVFLLTKVSIILFPNLKLEKRKDPNRIYKIIAFIILLALSTRKIYLIVFYLRLGYAINSFFFGFI
jgi:hypothetical protein